jgi:hypothetical protein
MVCIGGLAITSWVASSDSVPPDWVHRNTRNWTLTGAVPVLLNHSASAPCDGVRVIDVGETCRLAAEAVLPSTVINATHASCISHRQCLLRVSQVLPMARLSK